MNILISPNSMKSSINAFDFAEIVCQAFEKRSELFCCRMLPVADGGDFTGEVLKKHFGAVDISAEVVGPLGRTLEASYAIAGETAIIEMAEASGMKIVDPSNLNPLNASSFGTGQLIQSAIQKGCSKLYLAIGGSATVDGGMGMMEALGFKFFDDKQNALKGSGGNLSRIKKVELPDVLPEIDIKIICDVENRLLGNSGAARVYGPQKGATPGMVEELETGLSIWADLLEESTGKSLKDLAGTGAAGGLAVPLIAFLKGEIVPGADFVLKQLDFEKQVNWADIVITGEGKIDAQTLENKAPLAVARIARLYNKPVFAIGGSIEPEASEEFDGMISLVNGPMSLEKAMDNAHDLLFNAANELAKIILILNK